MKSVHKYLTMAHDPVQISKFLYLNKITVTFKTLGQEWLYINIFNSIDILMNRCFQTSLENRFNLFSTDATVASTSICNIRITIIYMNHVHFFLSVSLFENSGLQKNNRCTIYGFKMEAIYQPRVLKRCGIKILLKINILPVAENYFTYLQISKTQKNKNLQKIKNIILVKLKCNHFRLSILIFSSCWDPGI